MFLICQWGTPDPTRQSQAMAMDTAIYDWGVDPQLLDNLGGSCHSYAYYPLVIKHGLLENGPLKSVIFLYSNPHSLQGFSS